MENYFGRGWATRAQLIEIGGVEAITGVIVMPDGKRWIEQPHGNGTGWYAGPIDEPEFLCFIPAGKEEWWK